MDSNHRFLGVSQASLPLDHGTTRLAAALGAALCARAGLRPAAKQNRQYRIQDLHLTAELMRLC